MDTQLHKPSEYMVLKYLYLIRSKGDFEYMHSYISILLIAIEALEFYSTFESCLPVET